MYARNGTTPSHASERLRPAFAGRRTSSACATVASCYPTFFGHSVAIRAVALADWAGVANFTFAYGPAGGSAASRAFGITLRPTMSVKRAGCEYPFSQRSCPWSD